MHYGATVWHSPLEFPTDMGSFLLGWIYVLVVGGQNMKMSVGTVVWWEIEKLVFASS